MLPPGARFLVRLSDHKIYFMGHTLDGEMPPQVKYNSGAGVGKPPTEILVRWLHLLLEQKVARFKMRLKWKEYAEISAMAFSGDGSRLAVAQASRRPLARRNTSFADYGLRSCYGTACGHHARGLFH